MATTLQWNNDTGRYQATVDNQLIEVDGDVYAEARRDMMKHELVADGNVLEQDIRTFDLHTLPQETYDEYYDRAESAIGKAELWLAPPMDGLYIDGVAQFGK